MQAELEQAGVTIVTSSVLLEKRDDPRVDAAAYLKQHDIQGLFDVSSDRMLLLLACPAVTPQFLIRSVSIAQRLCAQLVYARPEDPRQYLISELRKLQQQNKVRGLLVGS